MGKLVFILEKNVREVNSLLAFHNVHPQVRSDVQRRLQRLIHCMYDHVGTLEPGYGESPEEICSAILGEVLEKTIQNVIPLAELATEEKRAVALEQRTKDLEAELRASEQERMELEKYIDRFRKVHEFMLHSYFREVLILRYQLHDLMSKRRAAKNRVHSPVQQVKRKQRDQQQQQEESYASVQKTSSLPSGEVYIDTSETVPVPNATSSADSASDITIGVSMPLTGTIFSTMVSRGGVLPVVPTTELMKPAPVRPQLPITAPPTPILTSKKAAFTAMVEAGGHEEGQEVRPQVRSVETQTVNAMSESVDAVFDYEEYIARLEISRGRGKKGKGDDLHGSDSGMLARERRLRERLGALRYKEQQALASKNGLNALRAGADEDGTLTRALSWRTSQAVQSVRKSLLDELSDIRSAVQRMQSRYQDDIQMLQNALTTVQMRADSLLLFLLTYAEEVRRMSAMLEFGMDALGTPDAPTTAGTAACHPCQRHTVSDYFTPALSLEASISSFWKDEGDNVTVSPPRDERHFWENNTATLEARRAFSDLQNTVLKFCNRGGHLQGRASHMGRNFRADDSGFSSNGAREGRIGLDLDEDDMDFFASLSREQLLKLLVQLRMKRIAYRARHRNRLRQLADDARNENSTEDLQQTLYEAWLHEQKVRKITLSIDKILRYLGYSSTDTEGERAFCTKNLALSPYLNSPLWSHEREEDVVYVPVPVNADRAADLCATLVSNQGGYVVINKDVIPISMIPRSCIVHPSLASGGMTMGVGGEGGKRRVMPFHGTVIDYCRGVQMGCPLGDGHMPFQVVWDSEERSFLFVESDDEPPTSVPARKQHRQPVQQMRQKQQRQDLNLATIMMPPPPFFETERTEEPELQPLPTAVVPRKTLLEKKPTPKSTFVPVEPVSAVCFHVQNTPRKLEPRSSSTLTPNRPGYLMVAQPRKEDRDLLRIESLSARQKVGRGGGADALPPPPPPPGSAVTALTRLKDIHRRKEEAESAMAKVEREHRMAQWKAYDAMEASVINRRFPRMTLPRIPAPLSSLRE